MRPPELIPFTRYAIGLGGAVAFVAGISLLILGIGYELGGELPSGNLPTLEELNDMRLGIYGGGVLLTLVGGGALLVALGSISPPRENN